MESQATFIIQSIKRTLAIEVLITIPMFVGAYFLMELSGYQFPIVSWTMLILLTFSGHIWLYSSLKAQASANESNKTKIKLFLNAYYPVLLWVNTIVLYEVLHKSLMYAIVGAGIVLLLLYFPIKWYVNSLYGKHYEALTKIEA